MDIKSIKNPPFFPIIILLMTFLDPRIMERDYEFIAGVILLAISLLFVLIMKLNGPP